MGLQPSKQPSVGESRLRAIKEEEKRALELQRVMLEAFAAEPADRVDAPDSASARLTAVVHYISQLRSEALAVLDHIAAQRKGRIMPMPHPTPPLRLPGPPQQDAPAAPEPASTSCGAQPSTPLGGASPHRGQRGNSSSSEEGAHTGDEQHGTGMPLLGAKTDMSALPGLRQRRGHQEGG